MADDASSSDPPRRPPSVRDVVGPPAPASPAPRDDDDGRRPTPARAAMGASREPLPAADVPTRTLRSGEGEEAWLVRAEGATVTGLPPDRGAPLLFLTFARESDPEARLREALTVGTSLEGLSDEALEEVLARSRAFTRRADTGEIFPGTRRTRGPRGQ